MDTETLTDLANDPSNRMLYYAVGALLGLLVFSYLARRFFRRRKKSAKQKSPASIRLAEYGATGPSANGPQLSYFGAPVRLALLVVAPAGRGGEPPPEGQFADIMDRAIPGLGKICRSHKPVIQRWAGQLSQDGFNNTFFRTCGLPQQGTGTPWCNVAGPIVDDDRRYFVGLLLRSEKANNLKQLAIQKETQWLETLKVSDLS